MRLGNGFIGWNDYASFDKIILTCTPEEIPDTLVEQLKDGGKMILPVGHGGIQKLDLVKIKVSHIDIEKILPVRFVPMVK